MAVNGAIVWEWEDQFNVWEPYEPHVSDYIERNVNSRVIPLQNADAALASYTVDTTTMLQTRVTTGTQRRMKRSLYGPMSTSAQGISWQFSGDRPNQWVPYSMSAQNIIEDAYKQGIQQVDLSNTVGLPYNIDLLSMSQTRLNTGNRRRVRRVATTPYTLNTGAVQPAGSMPGTANMNNPAPTAGAFGNSGLTSKSGGSGRMPTRQSVRLQALQNGGNLVHLANGTFPFSGYGAFNPGFGQAPAPAPAPAQGFSAGASGFSGSPSYWSSSAFNMQAVPPAVSGMTNVLTGSVLPNVMSSANPGRMGSVRNDAKIATGKDPESVVSHYSNPFKPPKDEECSICLCELNQASEYGGAQADVTIQLKKCKHLYHKLCLIEMYKAGAQSGSLQCPTCKTMYGEKRGICPPGQMDYCVVSQPLPTFNCDTIRISYYVNSGTQTAEHPNPGRPYHAQGFPRIGYLPNNDTGRKILKLLIKAWERRLTFTIGTSVTTGRTDSVVWNEIHHKTEFDSNNGGHGYPDPNYFQNVIQELADQGVTEDS